MGRLIDTDAITDFMLEHNIPDSLFASVEEIVAYQPTAFDIEAVVKKLEEYKKSKENLFVGKVVGAIIDYAIELVNKGGVK